MKDRYDEFGKDKPSALVRAMTQQPSSSEAAELLPCPFCGSTALIDREFGDEDGGYHEIACTNCTGAEDRFIGVHSADRSDAVKWWNSRPAQCAPVREAAARLIDPEAYEALDELAKEGSETSKVVHRYLHKVYDPRITRALGIADTILALTSASSPAQAAQASPQEVQEACAQVADRAAKKHCEAGYNQKADVAGQIATSIRALIPPAASSSSEIVDTSDFDEYPYDDERFNKGVEHVVALLAKTIGAPDTWPAGDGSEDYDEDLAQTLHNILGARGLYDRDTGQFAQCAPGIAQWIAYADKLERALEIVAGASSDELKRQQAKDGLRLVRPSTVTSAEGKQCR